eukprot:CAMPEP_0196657350 /NCGR_PEP_ID=MMETSP1086-20130531/22676_1 /TAXON_ID=77921 /ORGANISM="Cyanoptyche  gloeocystis , Strain SAG4.97" /LENGTH=139 /DNA_ID=CAMNT_0041990423 /DNA_START=53 /DNA_END=469 /DNA_ORIENTATION=+
MAFVPIAPFGVRILQGSAHAPQGQAVTVCPSVSASSTQPASFALARHTVPSLSPPIFAATRSRTLIHTPHRRSLAAPLGFFVSAEASRDEVTERVLSVVKKLKSVDPEKVTITSNFVTDLGLDSLDVVEVVMAFEEEFG